MVTCSGVVDGGRWKGELIMATEHQQHHPQQHAMKSARPLVYDVDTGTLRFCKPRASLSKSPAHSRSPPLNAAEQEETVADDDKLLTCGAESGESSPTCVIENSAVRSNSSSPTMSTVSKASSNPGRKSRDQEARRSFSASSTTTTTTKSASPESGSEPYKTPPFKSIQSAAAEKTLEPKNSSSSSSIMHKAPGIFSFNATYVTRAGEDLDDELAAAVRPRTTSTFLAPLLKPAPSKWDDAEKWVPGSGRSRSGPLLAQMVASQAGMLAMPIPSWKPHLQKIPARDPGHDMATADPSLTTATTSAHTHASDTAQSVATDPHSHTAATNPHPHTGATEPHVHTLATDTRVHTLATDSAHFPTDSTDVVDEKLTQFLVDTDGASSPSCMNGSFMKLGVRMHNTTRDFGTAMTPINASVEPSPDLRDGKSGCGMGDAEVRVTPVVAMTEEEVVAKTRQEIVALGTQLGKASIAAAWAARHQANECVVERKTAENVYRAVSRADAWKEAETAKYTFRFQQEEAKIAAWKEYEKAKAEAEMLRVEAKAEHMKAQAHEKLANKVVATARQGEKLRHAAETRRTEAAAKAARKAELMKRHGKITNLFFLSFLCT